MKNANEAKMVGNSYPKLLRLIYYSRKQFWILDLESTKITSYETYIEAKAKYDACIDTASLNEIMEI